MSGQDPPDWLGSACYDETFLQGDGGGPLITAMGNNNYQQIGVVSWMSEYGARGYPSVYAR